MLAVSQSALIFLSVQPISTPYTKRLGYFRSSNSYCTGFSGYPSTHSSIFCSPSTQSPSMEAPLDSDPGSHDIHHAHKSKGDDWNGTTKACNLVRE
ncbi:hypothetical protein SLEP1_g30896 [Rubroshorea leprosula]|uniref:Uncharacterized protein n=1 Tax=Rubroshorea leprosula TaxID=152421 RepID=A0AAV5K7E2_9ROSI|nr:hypothetical protein SLEP1_g30896 [Rubroshorea leprosula]